MAFLKNILFVIPSLHGGGAERVVCSMANYWAEKNCNVMIATLASANILPSYTLTQDIKIFPLDILGKRKNSIIDNIARIKKLHCLFKNEKPDIILSFMESTNVLTLLSATGLKIPIIISDRIDPKSYSYGAVWRILRNITYPFSTYFIVQTKSVLAHYPFFLKYRAKVVPNFINISIAPHEVTLRQNKICAMGRLNRQKGFDILLQAFSKISPQFPEWSLEIWGEGEEHQTLEQQAKDLKITERVRFPGFSKNPDEILRKAGIFILSSRYEGFPNVLIEAMATGAPVIATRCPCGPEEIIKDGENGVLISQENPEIMAEALSSILRNSAYRKKIGAAAQKSMHENYNQNIIMQAWEDIICAA